MGRKPGSISQLQLTCPECGHIVATEGFRQHLEGTHDYSRQKAVAAHERAREEARNAGSKSVRICPKCGVALSTYALHAHMMSAHGLRSYQARDTVATAPTVTQALEGHMDLHRQLADLRECRREYPALAPLVTEAEAEIRDAVRQSIERLTGATGPE